ncbi:hypothetical protein [Fervidobacterium thailandense]|uniref:Uncharacterized protein n=1 Tax=Fervidobacterium thailandense TaxID=1008305 RepID=A0A1E3G4B9_9BACT|nr:hypothetical protein [Fervidobacterium thailandense]ODN31097.1 hypothetical protein A4H02_02170 [Fervidobacterium thailandense]
MKRRIVTYMVNSIISLLLLVILYTWSAYKLHLATFLVDREIFNFFILYVPVLLFFSLLFLSLEDTFNEVKRLIWYSFVPVVAFQIGWYGLSFNLAFPICYALSNVLIKPNFKARVPLIVFNGVAILILVFWRSM